MGRVSEWCAEGEGRRGGEVDGKGNGKADRELRGTGEGGEVGKEKEAEDFPVHLSTSH